MRPSKPASVLLSLVLALLVLTFYISVPAPFTMSRLTRCICRSRRGGRRR